MYNPFAATTAAMFSSVIPCGFIGISGMLSIAIFVFWVFMLIDAIQRDEKSYANQNDKLMWVLIVALANWLGAAIYYFMIYREKGKSKK